MLTHPIGGGAGRPPRIHGLSIRSYGELWRRNESRVMKENAEKRKGLFRRIKLGFLLQVEALYYY